ncbi:hypothetical protein SAMN05660690_3064 [Geodermatophilus telluris]|uniref:Uncharacterized protein n=1 Tax=Geodermatophilus telluris TaxID=1190417 RepID=A0A1G6QR32_9ACTN|nr:hypothetical protein [Geodermatophilus telluris]SDC94731.1 hypothetical protein SAMN05660690_3064 [Geodermatophilus telluris]
MRTRTAGRALTVLLATAAMETAAGTAAAAPPEGAGTYTAYRGWALFTGGDGLVADVTVEEERGAGTVVRFALYREGLSCTVDGEDVAVAEVDRLDSARLEVSYDYTCTAADDGSQGLAPESLTGTVDVDLTWTGVGRAERQPLYDCTVGLSLSREALVSGGVSLTGDLAAELDLDNGGLSHDNVACPPGRV